DDMRRRDFTVNAVARRLATGELVDPLGGARDLEQRVLRTVSPRSFAEDPLRLVRGLRFVSQLDFDPAPETLEQMRAEAASVRLARREACDAPPRSREARVGRAARAARLAHRRRGHASPPLPDSAAPARRGNRRLALVPPRLGGPADGPEVPPPARRHTRARPRRAPARRPRGQ